MIVMVVNGREAWAKGQALLQCLARQVAPRCEGSTGGRLDLPRTLPGEPNIWIADQNML